MNSSFNLKEKIMFYIVITIQNYSIYNILTQLLIDNDNNINTTLKVIISNKNLPHNLNF